MNNQEIMNLMEEKKIIAIGRGVNPEKAVALAEALYAGGITILEFPFNMKDVESRNADRCIEAVTKAMGDKMVIGCGTASYPELVERTHAAGGRFVISADCNPAVIQKTKELGMISIPGVATGTEVMSAMAAGADYAKLFPAGELGLGYLKALKGPFGHVKYMAVGGVGLKNIADFIKAGCVGVGIGGALVDNKLIEAGEFDKITALAKEYVEAVNSVK